MNTKKVAAILAAGLLSTSAVAFAADSTSSATTNKTRPAVTSTQNNTSNQNNGRSAKPELTAEQKAAREQKAAAKEQSRTKWAALSTAQKNQVYAIEEKIVALEKEKIDQLVSLGVIDKATGDAQKQRLDEKLANWKSSGEYPSGRGSKGDRPARQ